MAITIEGWIIIGIFAVLLTILIVIIFLKWKTRRLKKKIPENVIKEVKNGNKKTNYDVSYKKSSTTATTTESEPTGSAINEGESGIEEREPRIEDRIGSEDNKRKVVKRRRISIPTVSPIKFDS